jgi:hypothetical protein
MEPVGVAVLINAPAVLATIAVNVTDCPRIDGFAEDVTVVEVGAGLTVWFRFPELPLKPPSVFVYTALMACGEPLTLRVAVAPLVAITAVPDPESGTAAPKMIDCPKIDGFTGEFTVVEVGTQVGMAEVVLDGALSCGGFVFASTAVTKYE